LKNFLFFNFQKEKSIFQIILRRSLVDMLKCYTSACHDWYGVRCVISLIIWVYSINDATGAAETVQNCPAARDASEYSVHFLVNGTTFAQGFEGWAVVVSPHIEALERPKAQMMKKICQRWKDSLTNS
jgi:hypothetical protein